MVLLQSAVIILCAGYVMSSQECVDRISSYRCAFIAKHGACKNKRRLAGHYCPRTCGMCGEKCYKSTYGCCRDGFTEAKGPDYHGCHEYCSDQSSPYYCRAIKRVGFCKKQVYAKGCLFTCKNCRVCRDTNKVACKEFADSGKCEKDFPTTYNHCRKTCNVCGKKDPCYDFKCPGESSKCRVDGHGKPFCGCRGHCKTEDHFTGAVCGRDDKEYKNLCQLKHSNCHLTDPVEVKTYGNCPKYNNNSTSNSFSFPNCVASKYGCCVDGISFAQGPHFKGCPKQACEDKLSLVCKRFRLDCPNPVNKTLMRMLCPSTCFYCLSPANRPVKKK